MNDKKGTILVVDDDSTLRDLYVDIFKFEGYEVFDAASGEEGLQVYRHHKIDLVLLDLKLPDADGLITLDKILVINPLQLVIILSGHATIEKAVEATRLGAYDFLEKPISMERLLLTLKNALEKTRLLHEKQQFIQQPERRYRIVGVSPVLRKIFSMIDKVAPTNSIVLLNGESGTGKDLVAQAIHYNSFRADKQFYRLNCAAIPDELVESELFGYARGAFTNAYKDKKGLFLLADHSTLFLDEIGDLSLRAQAKVLTVIETGVFTPVGSETSHKVDVRIICATNQDLEKMIKYKKFREDLFHRINVVNIQIPPLRKRKEDITPLALHFLDESLKENQQPQKRFSLDALELLSQQPWYGNVRELKNFIERLCVLSDSKIITGLTVSRALNLKEDVSQSFEIDNYRKAKEIFETNFIISKLIKHNWNVSRMAKATGMDRANLYRKMKRHGIYSNKGGESKQQIF